MCIASSATGRSVIGVVKVMTIGLATPTVDPFDGFTDARLKEAVPEGVSSTAAAFCSNGAEVSDGSTTSVGDGSVGESTLPSGSASACGAITKPTRTVRAPIAAAARVPVGLRICISRKVDRQLLPVRFAVRPEGQRPPFHILSVLTHMRHNEIGTN